MQLCNYFAVWVNQWYMTVYMYKVHVINCGLLCQNCTLAKHFNYLFSVYSVQSDVLCKVEIGLM